MKKYKRVIIVDEDNRPLSWSESDKQLCYCTNEDWDDDHFPVTSYTEAEARHVIKKTIRNRKRWGVTSGVYKTMPVSK